MNVEGLTFRYPKSRIILNNVSFKLKEGKLNVLVGLNGSGKTTLFDCVTKVLDVKEGTINFPDIKNIMYLTQTLYFSYAIKGKDIAKYINRLNNLPGSSNINCYTKKMNNSEIQLLMRLWDVKFGKMSVGERKLLFLMLFSQIDRLLYIFDEPTSGVDPLSRLSIYNKINQLISEGKTCLISTHQLQDLSHFDCHLIILHDGNIKYCGDFKDWLAKHKCDNPDLAFQKEILN